MVGFLIALYEWEMDINKWLLANLALLLGTNTIMPFEYPVEFKSQKTIQR